ncbi:hypothetical protein [cyanobacterium endosymbiont of Epithemia turgida]|uniref:hypothetical protein n=1 Tax=cyanobacterium endosymbiont of Epithemia turgida TaxID=718217 RepID=UPI0004D1BCEE|nr:hypothetical protein [cyanobacterium endosymbiont of Epithemia turgida]BAP17797.1 hypothetical protein ETSB_1008 [cyanobacterium endosymbiont of Epithemia turgida isolate EtSB Lake Yunoko]
MTIPTFTHSFLPDHQSPISSSTQLRSQTKIESNSVKQLSKSYQGYQAIQQLKYLHLEAEIDVLLQELQTMKQNNQMES